MDYLLNSSMEVLDEDYQPKDTDIVVSLVTTEESCQTGSFRTGCKEP